MTFNFSGGVPCGASFISTALRCHKGYAPLFFQSLEIAGKKDILEEYIKTLAPTD